ncbi:hypothetical protein rosag_14910 [Roseisolibacter agri]|uniref:Uncharacterized protein n=1 Tax=Roseisolibacter agri TaxID=2014610 RepID=A0AA37QDZ6_9BACT|nr:hypothetical protein rosag_14910 [Roseisolibacter agri]
MRGSQQEWPLHPIRLDQLSAELHAELDHTDRTAKDSRLRIRALIVLLVADHGTVADIAAVLTSPRRIAGDALSGLTPKSDASTPEPEWIGARSKLVGDLAIRG